MLAIALLVLSGDPIDDPPSSSSSTIAVRLHIARINGAAALEKQTIATLDDIVLLADSNATSARYQWQLVEKPASSTVALTSDDGREQRFRFFIKDRSVPGVDVAGVYRVRVDVIGEAGSASDEIEVHVGAGHTSSTSIAPDRPKHDTLGAQLAVGGFSAGCCLATAGVLTIGAVACGSGMLPTILFAACPCALAGASVGACIGSDKESYSVVAAVPWLPLFAFLELGGLILTIDGAIVGAIFLHGERDVPVPWFETAAPALPGLAVMAAAPGVALAVAWLTTPDELIAR